MGMVVASDPYVGLSFSRREGAGSVAVGTLA